MCLLAGWWCIWFCSSEFMLSEKQLVVSPMQENWKTKVSKLEEEWMSLQQNTARWPSPGRLSLCLSWSAIQQVSMEASHVLRWKCLASEVSLELCISLVVFLKQLRHSWNKCSEGGMCHAVQREKDLERRLRSLTEQLVTKQVCLDLWFFIILSV